jgi:hypothetical protein
VLRCVCMLAGLALALGVLGCSNGDRAPASAAANRCDADGGCPRGACDPIERVCAVTRGSTEVVFWGQPQGTATMHATPTRLDPRTVAAGVPFDIRLQAPRLLVGSVGVRRLGSAALTPVAATIHFLRKGAPVSEPPSYVYTDGSPANGEAGRRGYSFSIPLAPGWYDVTVVPDSPDLPPYIGRQQVETDPSGAPQVVTFAYGALDHVTGRLIDTATGEPINGVMVQAVVNGAAVSTRATTGARRGDGDFDLVLSPASGPDVQAPQALSGVSDASWSLRVSSPPPAPVVTVYVRRGSHEIVSVPAAIPTAGQVFYEIARSALPAGEASGLTVRLTHGAALRGYAQPQCIGCVTWSATVEGSAPNGAQLAMVGATVDLHSEDVLGDLPAGHRAWVDAEIVAAADGSVSARLVPGTYDTVVTPTGQPAFAVTSWQVEVGPMRQAQLGSVLEARLRVPVRGRLIAAGGAGPMGDVSVEAVPLAPYLPAAMLHARAERFARPASANTGADGAFALGLDPGPYRLVYRPPAGSGYATQLDPDVLWVPNDPGTTNGDTPTPVPMDWRAMSMDLPLVASGRVFDGVGAVLPGATLRAFARVSTGGDLGILDIELSGATADATGGYTILLPSRAAP